MVALSSGGPLREVAYGPLRSVAEFYIPFRLFQIDIVNRGKPDRRIFGLDAVNGSLDPYYFEQLPRPQDMVCLETRNCPSLVLDHDQAEEIVVGKVQRLLFTAGFFRIRGLRILAEPVAEEIYIPYWVGFRGRGQLARPAVMDAMRQRMEGLKVRHLLQGWLLGQQG